jgi:hypothetical protein
MFSTRSVPISNPYVLVGAVHHREGLFLRCDRTEAVGPEPQSAHEQAGATQVRVFHVIILF